MVKDKITWEQFSVSNINPKGISFGFEDLCRQLFYNMFLANNYSKILHCNPNNPGLEAEPIFHAGRNQYIGFQAKYFNHSIDYKQILHSAKEVVANYEGKIDCLILFCNKSISINSKGYRKIVEFLKEHNIAIELINNEVILDKVRQFPYLGTYYFNQHDLSFEWFKDHSQIMFNTLGERYNTTFNIDTDSELKLSLFVHDIIAVKYLNSKKSQMITQLDENYYRYKDFSNYVEVIRTTINAIKDIDIFTICDAISWYSILTTNLESEQIILINEKTKIEEEIKSLKNTQSDREGKEKKYNLSSNLALINELIDIKEKLHLTIEEVGLLNNKIVIIEGDAGYGKSHLLANKTKCLIRSERETLLLLGIYYLTDELIEYQICKALEFEFSFSELLSILEVFGELNNKVVPIFIDALNESGNLQVWKNGLPKIFREIQKLSHVKLAISFRTEYEKSIIGNINMDQTISKFIHRGFSENYFEALKHFFNAYNIPFSPLCVFNKYMKSPLYLTIYCKVFKRRGNIISLANLYDELLEVANDDLFKLQLTLLQSKGYNAPYPIIKRIISEICEYFAVHKKKSISQSELENLPIWRTLDLPSIVIISFLVEENILNDYMFSDEEKIYFFSFDQMNDFYRAKYIVAKYKRKNDKEGFYNYIKDVLINKEDGKFYYYEVDFFINLCALYFEEYNEECIQIIDSIDVNALI